MGSSIHYCSTFALCAAAVATLTSVAFMSVAFSTDNWRHISVDRTRLDFVLVLESNTSSGAMSLASSNNSLMNSDDFRLYDRIQGIFRLCFPHELKPPMVAGQRLYLNPVEEWCANNDYYFNLLENKLLPERLTSQGELWFHFARSAVAGFCLYFMFTGVGSVTGLMGCWRASGDHLISTALLLLLAFLSLAAQEWVFGMQPCFTKWKRYISQKNFKNKLNF